MALPRLTGAIRVFGSVSAEDTGTCYTDGRDLWEKRRHATRKQTQGVLDYHRLEKIIGDRTKAEGNTVTRMLRELYKLGKDFGRHWAVV